MTLLELKCNNPKFKTLTFKEGLNIIAGIKLTGNIKKTYNGIGKSMSLNLIQYILGANIESKKIKNFLKTYGEFTLTFEHKGKKYKIVKDFSNGDYYVNDEKIKSGDYSKYLTNLFLKGEKSISFRNFFNCFARRYEGTPKYYSDALTQQGMSKADYQQRLTNLFLLKLDIKLVEEKKQIKEEINKLKDSAELIKKYEKELNLKDYQDIKDKLDILKSNQKNFIIEENYEILKNEADELTNKITDLRNFIYDLEKKIRIKNKNLEDAKDIDISIPAVVNMFNEAKFYFQEKIKIKLEEAQEFHKNIITNRNKRITKEIYELSKEIELKKLDLNKLTIRRDFILKELSQKGALEEFNAINENIKELEKKIIELEKYKNLSIEFNKKVSDLKVRNSQIQKESTYYLSDNEKELEKKESVFRGFVKQFYEDAGGNLKIKETKDAKYLYDIDVYVPKDGSQGVGGVKIFCYDMLLFSLNKEVLNFLAHDGYIFSGMDPRQISTLFKIILEYIKKEKFQYLVNMNEDNLKSILNEEYLDKEMKEEIKKSIQLQLNDKDPKNWLFGEAFA